MTSEALFCYSIIGCLPDGTVQCEPCGVKNRG